MSNFQKGMFDKIQQNANITPDEILKVANSVKHANFSDETTVRNLVRQLAKMANKSISQEKEDKLVNSIVKKKIPMDQSSLKNLFDK